MLALPYMEKAALQIWPALPASCRTSTPCLPTTLSVATNCFVFKRIKCTNLARQVLVEVEDQLVTLSYDKYSHQLLEVFLEHGQTDIQEQVVISKA